LLFYLLHPAQQKERLPRLASFPFNAMLKTQTFQWRMFGAAADTAICK